MDLIPAQIEEHRGEIPPPHESGARHDDEQQRSMPSLQGAPWNTHEFKVKMLDWSAARGSRLTFSCRFCGRSFSSFTILSRGAWAVDSDGRELDNTVTYRWLMEKCPRTFNTKDDDDRKRLSKQSAFQRPNPTR
jgi:hypothetical protein